MTEGVMSDALRNGNEECSKIHTVAPTADGSIAFSDVDQDQAGEARPQATPEKWQGLSNRRHR